MPSIDLGEVTRGPYQKNVLWEGANYILDTTTVTPSKPLSQCANGWILVWCKYEPGQGVKDWTYNYSYIHKYGYQGAKNTVFMLPALINGVGMKPIFKTLYISDTYFKGHTENDEKDANNVCLFQVIEW